VCVCVCVDYLPDTPPHFGFFMRQEKTVKPQNPKCDESGTGRDESGALGTNRAHGGTNQRREVPLPDAPARSRHALRAAIRDHSRIGRARSAPPSNHIGNTGRALGAALGAAGFCRNHQATLSMETPEKTSIRQTSARVMDWLFALKIHVSPVRFRPCPLKDSGSLTPRGVRPSQRRDGPDAPQVTNLRLRKTAPSLTRLRECRKSLPSPISPGRNGLALERLAPGG